MRLIETIKKHNPICRAMNQYKESAKELRKTVRDSGKEAVRKTLLKEEKTIVHP